MAHFTLDSIREAADKKYDSTEIELKSGDQVSLLNPLRLPKEKRKQLMKIQDSLDGEDADQEDVLADAIRLVADDEDKANELIKEVGGDLAVLAQIFELYTGDVQVGEASASQS